MTWWSPYAKNAAADADIAETHDHPPLTQILPQGKYRRGAILFGSAANGQEVVMGYNSNLITYTFETTLGSPAANNVQVKVQGTIDLTIRKLVQAIQGVTDAANIAYGTGTQPNPDIQGAYTSQQIAIGTTILAAGSTLYIKFKVGDRSETSFPVTLTTTTVGSTLVAFTRVFSSRYSVPGGGADINDHVAGALQTLVPMQWVYDNSGNLVLYDSNIMIVEGASSGTTVYECDLYYSTDEINFVLFQAGLNLSFAGTNAGSQQYLSHGQRIPAGAGLYIKVRGSNNATETIDLKVQYHQYPLGV